MSLSDAPRLTVEHGDLEKLLDYADTFMDGNALDWDRKSFSCSRYQVWPTPGKGHTVECARVDLKGQFPLLDKIVDLILADWDNGKRFQVNQSGVLLTDDDVPQSRRQVCHFDLVQP